MRTASHCLARLYYKVRSLPWGILCPFLGKVTKLLLIHLYYHNNNCSHSQEPTPSHLCFQIPSFVSIHHLLFFLLFWCEYKFRGIFHLLFWVWLGNQDVLITLTHSALNTYTFDQCLTNISLSKLIHTLPQNPSNLGLIPLHLQFINDSPWYQSPLTCTLQKVYYPLASQRTKFDEG